MQAYSNFTAVFEVFNFDVDCSNIISLLCVVCTVGVLKETEGGGDDQSGESGGRWSSRRHMESTEVTLDQLAYNTVYLLRVKAVSSTGSSDFSPPIVLTTWPLREFTAYNLLIFPTLETKKNAEFWI